MNKTTINAEAQVITRGEDNTFYYLWVGEIAIPLTEAGVEKIRNWEENEYTDEDEYLRGLKFPMRVVIELTEYPDGTAIAFFGIGGRDQHFLPRNLRTKQAVMQNRFLETLLAPWQKEALLQLV